MGEKLDPCPFCNDPMIADNSGTFRHVEQGKCIIGQQAWADAPNYRAAWNTRTPAGSEPVAWMCPDGIRQKATRILERMRKTPDGPKRKLLAAQHVDLTNRAHFAEGWNAALATHPTNARAEVEREMVAWLRGQVTCGCGREDCIADNYPLGYADAIERGDWKP